MESKDNTNSGIKNSINALKESIVLNLPNNRGELIYIYFTLGDILFRQKMILNSLYDKNDSVYCDKLIGIVQVCKVFNNKKIFDDLINYTFVKALNKLQSM